MKKALLFAPVLLLAPAALAFSGGTDGQGLTRVPPRDPRAESQDDEAFQAAPWRVLLADEDLDRREESFDRLVRRARRDPEARAFLKDLAAEGGELAWTARLALRELRRGGLGFFPPDGFGDGFGVFGGVDPFSTPFDELLQGLAPGFHLLLPPGQGLHGRDPSGGLQGGLHQGRSVSVQKTGDGWRIEVTEEVNGERTTRVFEGESLEDILAEHPELEDELGLTVDGFPGGFRIDLSDPSPFGRLFPSRDHGFGWFQDRPGFDRKLGKSTPLRTDKLGVRVAPVTLQRAESLGLDGDYGLFVDSVVPATIASLLGVEPGSVLLRLEGRELRSATDISEILAARPPQGSLTLEWVDADGGRHQATWRPQPRSDEDEESAEPEDL